MALLIGICVVSSICSSYCSSAGIFTKKKEKFGQDNSCDYYTGIGPNGCARKKYCGSCQNLGPNNCSTCTNCHFSNNKCLSGKSNNGYYIPYDLDTPPRRTINMRYAYSNKIIYP